MKGFSVEVEGLNETLAAFKGVEKGMLDLRQLGAWKAVASEFRKMEKAQFAGEGVGKSGKWKPLKPKYAEAKRRKWGDKTILVASGRMLHSLTEESDPNHVFQESAQEMVIGTKDAKAGYHQSGTRRMPARPVIDPTPEQERQLMQPVQEKLKQLVGNAKLRNLRGF